MGDVLAVRLEGIDPPSPLVSRDFNSGAVPTIAAGTKATVTLSTAPVYAHAGHR